MFVLVTDLNDTGGKIRPGISADPQLPPLVCVTGAFWTSVTSASVCACVSSHEFVVSRADFISEHQTTINLSENPCETADGASCVYNDRGWLRLFLLLTPVNFSKNTGPLPWKHRWTKRWGGFSRQTVLRRQRWGNIVNQHPRWTTNSSMPKWSDFSSWATLTVTS